MDTQLRLPKVIDGSAAPGVITSLGEPCEPFGELSFTKMTDVYADKAHTLVREGARSFLLDGMASLAELRAAVFACRELELPIAVMMVVESDDSDTMGGRALAWLVSLQELGIAAFGLRDGGCGAQCLDTLCREIYPYAKVPLYARLSHGTVTCERLAQLLSCGVESFGCLELDTAEIALVRTVAEAAPPCGMRKRDSSFLPANENEAFFLNPEHIQCSAVIDIEFDMADELIDFKDESYDVIVIELKSFDDGFHFGQNGHFLHLPVMLRSDVPEVLRMALLYYNGRALIDSSSPIDRETLSEIAADFGAIVY
ncbi:MAG: hypothetical protein QM689_09975 [Oscillospiraceae bacterium]